MLATKLSPEMTTQSGLHFWLFSLISFSSQDSFLDGCLLCLLEWVSRWLLLSVTSEVQGSIGCVSKFRTEFLDLHVAWVCFVLVLFGSQKIKFIQTIQNIWAHNGRKRIPSSTGLLRLLPTINLFLISWRCFGFSLHRLASLQSHRSEIGLQSDILPM